MSETTRWLERHTAHAPPVLRERVTHYAAAVTTGDLPARLAEAGFRALAEVERHPGDRSAALDLLAADALATLALLAQAEHEPSGLHAFAGRMLARAASPE